VSSENNNNNSPQALVGTLDGAYPNHRNGRIPVLYGYNKVGTHVRRKKKSAKQRQEEKEREKKRKTLPELLCTPLYATQTT